MVLLFVVTPICESLPYLRATPYLRGTFLSARHFPICEALSYLRGTSLSAKQPLSASYPLSARHFPILEPPPICEPHPYLRATLYLWVTSLSGSHPLSASHFPICEPPPICESLPYLGAPPLCTIWESHNFDYSLRQTWLNLISLMSQEICAVIILALSWAAVPSYNKSHIFSGIF